MVQSENRYDDMPYQPDQVWEIDNNWPVYGAGGDKIGEVSDVHPKYLIVSKGFLFPSDKYVPVGAIENVADQKVYLNVTKERINQLGWDSPPDDDAAFYDYGADRRYADRERAPAADEDNVTIPVVEEELEVEKRPVRRGLVRVRKTVETEDRQVDVPLQREEVHVERHPVERERTGDLPEGAFQEREYEIPIRGEEAEVTKRPVVREEVEVDKDVVQRTKEVGGTVRRTDVEVEGADVERRRRDRP